MPDAETVIALEADLDAVAQHAAELGAAVTRDEHEPTVYWLALAPPAAPQERFYVRIAWNRYPHAPPSVKFADGIGGRVDLSSAWPLIPGYRPGALDICQPFTAEGFATHPEWANGSEAWRGTGNPFLWVVDILIRDMQAKYGGRSA